MNRTFKRAFVATALLHGLVVLAVAVFPAWRGCAEPEAVAYLPIDLVVEAGPAPEPEAAPPEPEPAPPEPAPPEPAPEPRRRIERSTKRVTRNVGRSPAPPRRTMSAEQIRELLARGVKIRSGVPPSDDALYLKIIEQTMYRAWNQPTSLPPHLRATAALDFAPDGRIRGRELRRSSGDDRMDASVMEALRSVDRIPGLSPEFLRTRGTVTITFELGEGTG